MIEIPVTPAQAADAQAFVWQSLAENNGAIAPLRAGPYDDSLYYASSARYSGLHTCNTWAAQGLRAAQLRFAPEGVEFAGQLWRQALRLNPGPRRRPRANRYIAGPRAAAAVNSAAPAGEFRPRAHHRRARVRRHHHGRGALLCGAATGREHGADELRGQLLDGSGVIVPPNIQARRRCC